MKKIIYTSLACLAVVAMSISCGGRSARTAEEIAKAKADSIEQARKDSIKTAVLSNKNSSPYEIMEVLNEEPIFDILTTKGVIRVKLYSKTPKHKANFETLALTGFYDSLLFHRVINDFMIQTGDPNTRDTSLVDEWGKGDPSYTIPAEFVSEYTHKKGALAAARRGDQANPKKESSGSQFYIVQDAENCIHLNGEYTVFGETISGFPVIDAIAKVPTDRRDRPIDPIRIIRIIPIE
ncbi:MAG: peptidylprolyl isomerase [Bacteroidales bacterium]|nr:peptidylprolyl isomerase [Bacteroidales bacterium]